MAVGPLDRATERQQEEQRAFNEGRAPDFSEEHLAEFRPEVPEGEPEVALRQDEDKSEPMSVTTEPAVEAAVEEETPTEETPA